MAFVYWIHLPDHVDIFSEGYVGVTTKPVFLRMSQHISDANKGSNLTVHKSIRKYRDSVKVTTLLEGSEDYCYEMEAKLRGSFRLGWNIAIGGNKSPMSGLPKEAHPRFGKPVSDDTRKKISFANSGSKNGMSKMTGEMNHFFGKSHTEETISKLRLKTISDAHRQANRERMQSYSDWERPTAVKTTWVNAETYYKDFLDGLSFYQASKKYGLIASRLQTIFKRFKEGWIPKDDSHFQNWLSKQEVQ